MKGNRLLADLEPKEYAVLAPHLQEVALARGGVIAEAGNALPHLYFPLEGVLSLVGATEGGATVEVADVGRDGMASIQRGIETVGGSLYLTTQRLIFESHALNIQTGKTIIPLGDVKDVQTCWTKFLGLIPMGSSTGTAGRDEQVGGVRRAHDLLVICCVFATLRGADRGPGRRPT